MTESRITASPYTPSLLLSFCFEGEDILNTRDRDSVSSAAKNTSNLVKSIPLCVEFSTLFSVFGYRDKTLSLVFDILLINLETKGKVTVPTDYRGVFGAQR